MNQKNNGLIAAFVKKQDIIGFISLLYDNYAIIPNRVFVYNIENNPDEYLTTFKVKNKSKVLKEIKNSTIVHVKNGCVFSINALNQIINSSNNNGLIKNQEVKIDWDLYKSKLMMIKYGKLNITNIEKLDNNFLSKNLS